MSDIRGSLGRRRLAAAGALVLLLAAVHPPDGLGVEVCAMRVFAGADCPLCGLTRSASCAIRGEWRRSLAHHSLGIPLVLAASSVLLITLPRLVSGGRPPIRIVPW